MEFVELHLVDHRCHTRWRRHGPNVRPWSQTWVSVGRLGDGGWYVHEVGQVHQPASVYDGEESAYAAARARMAALGGTWQQVPCYPTADAVSSDTADG